MGAMPVTDQSVIVRNGDLLTTMVDGELLAMSLRESACFGMNRVATRVWELIEQPTSLADVCARLVQEFEVEPAVCREQVGALVDQMRTERLVLVRPA